MLMSNGSTVVVFIDKSTVVVGILMTNRSTVVFILRTNGSTVVVLINKYTVVDIWFTN